MVAPIEFRPCPSCGKSIRRKASSCYRCRAKMEPEAGIFRQQEEDNLADDFEGYDREEDDFDYEEFLEREFAVKPKRRPWWWFVAWLMVFVFCLPILLGLVRLLQ